MSDPVLAIIGAGPVGTGLARALVSAGYPVAGLASRRPESAADAARFAGCPTLSIEAAARQAEWLVLATPDDAIPEVVAQLPRRIPTLSHVSGALSSEVLRPAADRVVSMHPCASLPDRDIASVRLTSCWYGIEGDADAVAQAELVVQRLGGRTFPIQGDKALYHAGACVASNYLVVLCEAAEAMWTAAGVARPALYDLVAATLENVRLKGPAAALTGPIRRHDVRTVARHLHALREHSVPWSSLYRSMGRETLRMAPDEALATLLKDAHD